MEEKTVDTWNKKRVLLALILLIAVGIGAYFFKTKVLGEKINLFERGVKGASTQESKPTGTISIDLQKALKDKLDSLKKEVSNLNVTDIASSSPQVQKILNDMKSLEQYPQNQAKDICRKICGL